MKTCKTGCGKMKAGGSVKKVKKMATGGQALNKAKGFAKAQKGGDNVAKNIYGIPNAGTTGPNRTATYDYKKGGSIKKYPDGGAKAPKKPVKNTTYKKPSLTNAIWNKAKEAANDVLTYGPQFGSARIAQKAGAWLGKGSRETLKLLNDAGRAQAEAREKALNTTPVRKKGGAIKKYQGGGPTIAESIKQDRREIMRTPSGKIGIIGSALGSAAIGAKMIADKVKSKKAEKKAAEEKKKKETTKAKFGASTPVKTSCKQGMVRGADGNCVMSRPKFQKGGSFGMLSVKAGVDNNPNPTAADRIAGAKMKKKIGGSIKRK